MQNINISTVFPNVIIPAGQQFSFCTKGLSPANFYAYSVNGTTESVLTITSGWYNNGSFAGPGCLIENTGTTQATFNLILLTIGEIPAGELKAIKVG